MTGTRFKQHVFVPTFTFKGRSKQTTIWGGLVEEYEYALRGSFPAYAKANSSMSFYGETSVLLCLLSNTPIEKHGEDEAFYKNSNRLKSIISIGSNEIHILRWIERLSNRSDGILEFLWYVRRFMSFHIRRHHDRHHNIEYNRQYIEKIKKMLWTNNYNKKMYWLLFYFYYTWNRPLFFIVKEWSITIKNLRSHKKITITNSTIDNSNMLIL